MKIEQMKKYWINRYARQKGKEYSIVGNRSWTHNEYLHNSKNIMYEFDSVLDSGDTVIDYGCGIGRFQPLLLKHYKNYIGIDFVNRLYVEGKTGKNVKCFGVDAFFESEAIRNVDAVFCSVVLQHIVDEKCIEQTVDRFYDILNPGGKVYLNEQVGENSSIIIRDDIKYLKIRTLDEYEKLFSGFSLVYNRERETEPGHSILIFEKDKKC